jgi:DNA-binding IclR family transcriptional regulator
MQVVEALAEAPEPLSLAHLATQLAIPKTSLLNHLRVLVGAHYVALQEGRYVLGSAALRLGTIIAAESRDLARLAPVARQLAADSGETALLAMLDAAALDAVYLGVYEGAQPVRYSPAVGARRPLYCTAIGRALLASQPAAFIKGYFASTELARFNKRTVTDAARLRALLAKVQAAGLAATVAEHTEGVGALASPVGDRDGRVRYAIGVAVPATRIEPDRARLEKLVRNAARAAAWTLGAKRESAG